MENQQNNQNQRSDQSASLQYMERELAEIKDILKDQQRMIRRVYKSTRISFAVAVLKWIIIIGATVGAFYYVQPVFEAVMKLYTGAGGVQSGPNGEGVLQLWKGL